MFSCLHNRYMWRRNLIEKCSTTRWRVNLCPIVIMNFREEKLTSSGSYELAHLRHRQARASLNVRGNIRFYLFCQIFLASSFMADFFRCQWTFRLLILIFIFGTVKTNLENCLFKARVEVGKEKFDLSCCYYRSEAEQRRRLLRMSIRPKRKLTVRSHSLSLPDLIKCSW